MEADFLNPAKKPSLKREREKNNIDLSIKTSLLRRLQAQTLLDATSPIDKIRPFGKKGRNFLTTDAILMPFGILKSCIRETKHLSTDADSITDAID